MCPLAPPVVVLLHEKEWPLGGATIWNRQNSVFPPARSIKKLWQTSPLGHIVSFAWGLQLFHHLYCCSTDVIGVSEAVREIECIYSYMDRVIEWTKSSLNVKRSLFIFEVEAKQH